MRLATICVLAACGGSATGGVGDPVTQTEAARACVMFGSCMIDDGVNDCMTDILPTLPPDAVRCMGEANDCATALACIGTSFSAQSCGPRAVTCNGNTLSDCEQLVVETIECGSPLSDGPTCEIGPTGTAACGGGTCETNCANKGMACLGGVCSDAGGGGACAPGPDRCDGATIVSCGNDGVEVRIDCAQRIAGSTCHVAAGHSEAYCGFSDDCYPQKGGELCNGAMMTYCANGVVATFDCTSIGLQMCSTSNNGCSPL